MLRACITHRMEKRHHTIVIGGGQAGLSASYYLSQHNIDHVVLERARVGERWRSERWDSLMFQFPNRYLRLPGFAYDGDEPEAFMHRDGVVDILERYAHAISAPLRCGVNVEQLTRTGDNRFSLKTSVGEFVADNVIVATGPYQRTLIPTLANNLPPQVRQLPASAFTNANELPPGGVLVVGAGGSGVQITEDLLSAGRSTWLSVGHFRRIPRRYRGRDIMDWFEALGLANQVPADRNPNDHSPLLTGVNGGYEVDLRRIVAEGGTLLGRLEGIEGSTPLLGDQLRQHMEAAEQAYQDMVAGIETMLAAQTDDTYAALPAPSEPAPAGPMPPVPPTHLNLTDAKINTVIWATGYGVDFSWIESGEYDTDGMPRQTRGISTQPGLYFLGLAYLHTARSSFFWGVGDDAQHLVDHLANRSS